MFERCVVVNNSKYLSLVKKPLKNKIWTQLKYLCTQFYLSLGGANRRKIPDYGGGCIPDRCVTPGSDTSEFSHACSEDANEISAIYSKRVTSKARRVDASPAVSSKNGLLTAGHRWDKLSRSLSCTMNSTLNQTTYDLQSSNCCCAREQFQNGCHTTQCLDNKEDLYISPLTVRSVLRCQGVRNIERTTRQFSDEEASGNLLPTINVVNKSGRSSATDSLLRPRRALLGKYAVQTHTGRALPAGNESQTNSALQTESTVQISDADALSIGSIASDKNISQSYSTSKSKNTKLSKIGLSHLKVASQSQSAAGVESLLEAKHNLRPVNKTLQTQSETEVVPAVHSSVQSRPVLQRNIQTPNLFQLGKSEKGGIDVREFNCTNSQLNSFNSLRLSQQEYFINNEHRCPKNDDNLLNRNDQSSLGIIGEHVTGVKRIGAHFENSRSPSTSIRRSQSLNIEKHANWSAKFNARKEGNDGINQKSSILPSEKPTRKMKKRVSFSDSVRLINHEDGSAIEMTFLCRNQHRRRSDGEELRIGGTSVRSNSSESRLNSAGSRSNLMASGSNSSLKKKENNHSTFAGVAVADTEETIDDDIISDDNLGSCVDNVNKKNHPDRVSDLATSRIRCSLCRRKWITTLQMYCCDCDVYLSQFRPRD